MECYLHHLCFSPKRWVVCCLLLVLTTPCRAESPPVQLATIYQGAIDLDDYWVSEKLDGVRAYWNGKRLLSRRGNPFPAPEWFTAPLPTTHLDGELWIGRGQFATLSGIVRTTTPDETSWRSIRYMVFDLPQSRQGFTERLSELARLIATVDAPWIALVEQFRVTDEHALMQKLDEVTQTGGEGLMLHRADALHSATRNSNLLKLKRYQDAEAKVIAHLPGQGKYAGVLGSLLVENEQGKRFRIGSGFSDRQRENPPPVGATITYRFSGVTSNGLPRFASFMRIRFDY
ncbi:MAG: DNA ligase [Gammaproteobacteria bacterium]|nr:DNA ligase [Gammaproteobacteria bacterium]